MYEKTERQQQRAAYGLYELNEKLMYVPLRLRKTYRRAPKTTNIPDRSVWVEFKRDRIEGERPRFEVPDKWK